MRSGSLPFDPKHQQMFMGRPAQFHNNPSIAMQNFLP
jgi:hypothetical protein